MLSWWFGFRVSAKEFDVIDGDSINWRRGGWGADGQQTDGAVSYRLAGYDAPALGNRPECKSEREAKWGEAAKAFLKEKIEGASKLKLKSTGRTTERGQAVMTLYIDDINAADIMIGAKMAKPARWGADGKFQRWDWDDLWGERPEALR